MCTYLHCFFFKFARFELYGMSSNNIAIFVAPCIYKIIKFDKRKFKSYFLSPSKKDLKLKSKPGDTPNITLIFFLLA